MSPTKSDVPAKVSLHDPLLEVLHYMCGHHNKTYSSTVALQGLSLLNGKLTLNLFEKAAANLGLNAKLVARKPSKVSALVFPFIILFKNGEAGIALARNKQDQSIQYCIPGHPPTDISAYMLDGQSLDAVIYLTAAQGGETSSTDKRRDTMGNQKGHWLWSVVFRFWSNWINVAIAAFMINLLGLALPLFVMNVYDRVIPNNSIYTLWALAAGVLIALVFDFILRMLRSIVIDNSGRKIDMNVSSKLFKKSLDISMPNRSGRSGDIANQIREFETVRDFFTSASMASMIDLLFIGVFLGVLWLLVGELALIPLLAVPIVIIVTLFIQIPLAKSVAQSQATTANRHSVLIEALVGIETVKAISAEGVLQGRWDKAVAGSVRASSATKFWSSLAIYFTMFAQQIVSVGVIVWGVFLVADNAITVGALIAANILGGRVLAPLGGIAMTLARAQQSLSSLRQLNLLMKLQGDHDASATSGSGVDNVSLRINNLQFSYPDQDHHALDISGLDINPGERVGIVGMVGSGKSTLGKLLCGLYRPGSGTIELGDNEIRQYSMSDLRQAIAYVGQEPELFTGSVRENVLFTQNYDEHQFQIVTDTSGVANFVRNHPHGYDIQVGERGKFLSGGQRQAVALARAMMGSAKLYYLDEPTSSMDNVSEAAFIHGFANWVEPDTTIIIATHRNSLLKLVDRVVVLDKGKVVADGPREEIIKKLSNSKPKKGKGANTNG